MHNLNPLPENIYTVGGTVQAGTGFYIPREADERLLNLCRKKQYAYVLTTRQVGKSSLMVRTSEQLTDEGTRNAIIDLTALGVNVTADQWYQGLVELIAEGLMLQTNAVQWWREHQQFGNTQRLVLFFETVVLVEGPAVVFFDEIDTTRSMPFADDFFAALRFMWNDRAEKPIFDDLSFVLIGVATPHDLIQDPVRTPFNIGTRVDLKDWTYEEALPLAEGFGLDAKRSQEVLRWVLEWTSGHPYLTQNLCARIAEQGRTDWTKAAVAEVVAKTFFGSDRDFDTNLQFVRDMLTWRAPNKEAVLRIYKEIRKGNSVRDESPHKDALDPNASVWDEDKSLHKAHLKLAGLVRSEDGKLQVRNRIYYEVFDDEWIKEEMPVNWQKRLYYAAGTFVILLLCVTAPVSVIAVNRGLEAERQRKLAIQQANDLAQANKRYAEINEQLNKTNADLVIAKEGVAATNAKLAATNAKLTETNQQYVTTNKKLETSNGLIEKAKQEALSNAQQAKGAALRASEAEQRAITAREEAEIERAHALLDAQRAAASEAKTRNFLSSLYLKDAKEKVTENNPEGATAFLMAGYEQAKDLPGSKEKEILNLLTETSQLVKPRIDFGQSGNAEISPNGKYVISIDTAGKVRFWDSQTGALITELPGQGYSLPVGYLATVITNTRQLSWSNDSERFVLERGCGSRIADQPCKSSLALFEGKTGKLVHEEEIIWGEKESATSTSFYWPSANDRNVRFLTVNGKGIQLWNSVTGKPIRLISTAPSAPLWAAAGQRFITVGAEEQVQIWNAENGSEVTTLPVKLEVFPTLHADRSRVLTQNSQGVKLWDAMSGKWVNDLPITGTVDDFAVSNDEQVVYTHADKVQLWNAKDGALINELPVSPLQTLRFSYSILTVDAAGQVQLWDAKTGSHIKDLKVGVPGIVSTGSGERVLISTGVELSLWNARTGEFIKNLPNPTYSSVNWFDNDAWFLLVNAEGKGELRDGNTGELVRFGPLKYLFNTLEATSVTGKRILARNNVSGWLQLWDLKFEPITLDEVFAKAKCARFTVKDEDLVAINPPPCR
jgi:WD40 repeat protein